jgi:hypothetical protein
LVFDYLIAFPDHVAMTHALAGTASGASDIICVEPRAEIQIRPSEHWYTALRHESLRENRARDTQACEGLASPILYSPLASRTNEVLRLIGGEASARALGCTLEVAPGPKITRVAEPVPEAFVAKGARLAKDENEVIARIRTSTTLADTISIADDSLGRLADRGALPDGAEEAVARVDRPVPDRARILLAGSGPAVVGLRTMFQVGWRAWQGGQELPVIRVAGTELAVVAAGAEAIDLEYRPPGLLRGVLCGIAGLVVLFGALFFRKSRFAS